MISAGFIGPVRCGFLGLEAGAETAAEAGGSTLWDEAKQQLPALSISHDLQGLVAAGSSVLLINFGPACNVSRLVSGDYRMISMEAHHS